MSYRAIAAAQHCSGTVAFERVQRALNSIPAEAAERLKAIELHKLDTLERAAWKVLETYHYVIVTGGPEAGKIVYDPTERGKPLLDDAPVLAAIDRVLKVSEARRKLTGIDAPTRSRVEVITTDMVDAELLRLEAEIGRRLSGAPGEAAPAQGAASPAS
jgi:hypothetical protein